jgi:hypothetical protein
VSASEIIKELPKLTEAERRAVFNKLCELAEGDRRWEEIIDDERPRPKLDAFVEKARADSDTAATTARRLIKKNAALFKRLS